VRTKVILEGRHRAVALGSVVSVSLALLVGGCGGGGGGTASGSPAPTGAQAHDATLLAGQKVYSAECASCHGARGQGGVGPTFHDGRLRRDFPTAGDQVTFVSNGRGVMPSFAGVLTRAQLESVVAYERQVLAGAR
jgi:mono/diheme cytochrome c family protein